MPQDPVAAALLLAGGAGGLYLGQAVYYAVAAEVGGPFTSVISGMVSMGGQIAGATTASLTPFLATKYGWEAAFTVAGCVTFVCILPWFVVRPDRRLKVPAG